MPAHVDALADGLVAAGVGHAFGLTGGGRSLDLVAALAARGIAYHPVAHEAAAVMMAGAACRDGSARAVALGIKGPGLANMVAGIAHNAFECRPALTITEAYGPGVPAHRRHKRLDHVGLLGPLVKAHEFADGSAEQVVRLLAHAAVEVPGPVHLDLADEPVEAGSVVSESPAVEGAPLAALLEAVSAAERPAFVLGGWAARCHADLSAVRVPVATTAAAKGAYDETLPHAAGVVTGEVKELAPESAVLAHADLIVGIGLRSTEVVAAAPYAARTWIVDAPGAGPHDGFEPEGLVCVTDPAGAFAAIVDALAGREWGADLIAGNRAAIEAELFGSWLAAAAIRAAAETLPGAVLVPDTGLFCTVAETVWTARTAADFCGSSIGRFMGTALPTAIGIAAAEDRRTIAAVGDGGLRPYLPELRLAVDEGLPVTVLLLSDGRYGTFAAAAPGRGAPSYSVAVSDPGWAGVAEALGVSSSTADSPDDLATALAAAPADGPSLVCCRFDPDAYASMTARLR